MYSDYYVSQDGTLKFDQVPYFVVVDRLAAEKEQMILEKETWKIALMERQVSLSQQLVSSVTSQIVMNQEW